MAFFDDAIHNTKTYRDNFKGYAGNPPTSKAEYDALDCWSNKSTAPSWEEMSSAIDVLAVSDARKKAYPEITEQLDMLWHAIDSNKLDKTSDFYTTLKAVKVANPK